MRKLGLSPDCGRLGEFSNWEEGGSDPNADYQSGIIWRYMECPQFVVQRVAGEDTYFRLFVPSENGWLSADPDSMTGYLLLQTDEAQLGPNELFTFFTGADPGPKVNIQTPLFGSHFRFVSQDFPEMSTYRIRGSLVPGYYEDFF